MEEKVPYGTNGVEEASATREIRDRRKSYFFQTDNDLVLKFAKHIKPVGLSVYAVLSAHAGSKEKAWPSRKRMADILGVSKPTVDKGLQLLKDHGIIEIENHIDERGVHTSNSYTLLDISEWNWHMVEGGGSQNILLGVVKNFYQGGKKSLPEEYTMNNTKVEEDNLRPQLPPTEEAQLDPYTYYRVHIEGKKKLSEPIQQQIDHLVMKYGRDILVEAMRQALIDNTRPGKPGFNFIEVIATRLRTEKEQFELRKAAINRSEEGVELNTTLPEEYYLEVDGLQAFRDQLMRGLADE